MDHFNSVSDLQRIKLSQRYYSAGKYGQGMPQMNDCIN